MQRGSDKHGFRMDDALEAETRGLTQAGHDTRAEEWNTPEPSGEDQPDVVPGAAVRGGTPEGISASDLDERAQLASLLGKEIWPATSYEIQTRLAEENAPGPVLDRVAGLPAGTYENLAAVWEALTGERETQRF